jgi:transposase-like protein
MSGLIQITCPQCKSAFGVNESQVGTRITCPDCLEEFAIDTSIATKKLLKPRAEIFSPSAPDGPLDNFSEDLSEPFSGAEIPANPSSPNAAAAPVTPEAPYDFTTACPLCGTRQDVNSKQIGLKLKCPDCHLSFKVQEPHRSARRAHVAESKPDDGDIQLSEPVPSVLRNRVSSDWIAEANKDRSRDDHSIQRSNATPTLSPHDVIQQTLRNAAAEIAQTSGPEPDLPRHPFRTGVLRFLAHPDAVARWTMTAVALQIELAAIEGAIRAAQGGGFGQVFGLLFGIFATVFGFLLLCALCTSLLLVTQHSAQGSDHITGWPGLNVTDWVFECWPMLAALFITFAPGILLGQFIALVSNDQSSISWLSVGIGVISMTLFFPVLLLSLMENSSPYSRPIWRSIRVSQPVWLSFWLHSGMIVLVLGMLVRWRLRANSGMMGLVLVGAILFGLLIYFRLLGRLSWACDEALAKLEQESQSTSTEVSAASPKTGR